MSTKYVSLGPFTEKKPKLMEIIIEINTANVELFFNSTPEMRHLSYRGTNICIPCVIEVCCLGLEPLCDTHLQLSVILKILMLTRQEFFEV